MEGNVLAGRYRLDRLLGAGGMGEVWRGYDQLLNRPVAVKTLRRAGTDTAADLSRFRREARLAASLTDPHIVTVHDFGESRVAERPVLFLVMELLQGHSLDAVCQEGPAGVADVIAWGQQICAGLRVAHQNGVMHRDIKPANIWLTPDGTVKVLDFGIARTSAPAADPVTATDVVLGTPAYMAPEHARGRAEARSDLYSLGCLMYQLLAGSPPFVGSALNILAQHLDQQPAPVSSLRADLPPALADLVHQLLEKDPARRPRDAAAVVARLETIATHTRAPQTTKADSDSSVRPVATEAVAPLGLTKRTPVAHPNQLSNGAFEPSPASSGLSGQRPLQLSTFVGSLATGAATGAQGVVIAGWTTTWSMVVGSTAAILMVALFTDRPRSGAQLRDDRGSAASGLLAVLLTLSTTVFLLANTSVPWWAAVLTNALTGPALLAGGRAVAHLLHRVLHRPIQTMTLCSCAGMVNGFLAVLLLSDHEPAPLAFTTGTCVWITASMIVALLLPREQAISAE